MAFNAGGAGSGALSGAAAGSSFGPYGAAAGAVIGGLSGAFGGGDSSKEAAKAQNKYYARYVLPVLEKQQQTQQFFNNQALGTYAGSGNEAVRALTSLGTGNFGLSEIEGGRLGDLQGIQQQLQQQMASADPQTRLNAQSQLQELDSLMRGQAQGDQFGGAGGGLGDFLGQHPLTQAQNDIFNNQIQQQYATAFGGQAPSSFLGKAKGLAGSQSILDTYGKVTDTLSNVAGLGLGGVQAGVGANTGLANTTLGSIGQFGNANALGSAQAGEGAYGNQVLSSLGQFGEAFDPLNRQARDYASEWLAAKTGALQDPNAPGVGPQQQSFLGGLFS